MEKPNRITTVGQLRAALAGVPDDTPLIVNAEDPTYPEFADEQVITSTGFGRIDWGDGYGLQPDTVFGINCDRSMDSLDMRQKPARPPRREERRPQAHADAPDAEPEAEL